MEKHKITREDIANIEVGKTQISNNLKIGFFVAFFVLVLAVPCYQFFFGNATSFSLKKNNEGFNSSLIKSLSKFETDLEENSELRKFILPKTQTLFLEVFNVGNEKVWTDKNENLFYSKANEYVMSRGFLSEQQLKSRSLNENILANPVTAIKHFNEQLKAQNIQLIIVPVPSKISLVKSDEGTLINNESYPQFIKELKAENILICDLYKEFTSEDSYLKYDTHWSPKTMQKASNLLAKMLDSLQIEKGFGSMEKQPISIKNYGDIVNMLNLKNNGKFFDKQEVVIDKILENDSEIQFDKNADVLLLGDSFSNIFSLQNMNWGTSAGLFEQLSYHLQKPIDKIVMNNNGANATRSQLAKKLRRGENRLANKKVVIWEFASRELSLGNWKFIDLKYNVDFEPTFLSIQPKEEINVEAIVEDVSHIPTVGSVPYKDHIASVFLTDVIDANGKNLGDAVVYTQSMKNNQLTEISKLAVGQKVRFKLSNWEEKSDDFGSINRSEFDDDELSLQDPCWGEIIKN